LSAAIGAQALAKHRIAQHQERLALGSDYQNHDLVFCTTIGTPLQPRNVIARHLKPILAKAALPNIRWYDLRHTTASLLLRSGTNPKIVAERLGHSSVNLTHTNPQNKSGQSLKGCPQVFDN
jgi:integrase